MLFDVFRSRIIIEGRLVAKTPVHIGTNTDTLNPLQIDSQVLKDRHGRAVIPGSSLKGVIRSMVEGVLANSAEAGFRSCSITDRENTCEQEFVRLKNLRKKADIPDREFAEKIYNASCDVCRLFGSKFMASKVQFKDAYMLGDRIDYERRDGVGIDRDTGIALDGAKYDFEIVPAGTEFGFYMTAENLEESQKKILEMIVKCLESGDISVGGKTSRGLGKVGLKVERKVLQSREDILESYGLTRGEAKCSE